LFNARRSVRQDVGKRAVSAIVAERGEDKCDVRPEVAVLVRQPAFERRKRPNVSTLDDLLAEIKVRTVSGRRVVRASAVI
jgi:hypothetical protein